LQKLKALKLLGMLCIHFKSKIFGPNTKEGVQTLKESHIGQPVELSPLELYDHKLKDEEEQTKLRHYFEEFSFREVIPYFITIFSGEKESHQDYLRNRWS